MRRTLSLVFALLLSVSSSGCLRDEIFPEPFGWKPGGTFEGQGDGVEAVDVPADAQRMRFRFAIDFSRDTPILGEQAGVEVRLRDPLGEVYAYRLSKTGEIRDTFAGSVAGPWRMSVSDPGAGAPYEGGYEWFVPKHDDWAWWKVWKG